MGHRKAPNLPFGHFFKKSVACEVLSKYWWYQIHHKQRAIAFSQKSRTYVQNYQASMFLFDECFLLKNFFEVRVHVYNNFYFIVTSVSKRTLSQWSQRWCNLGNRLRKIFSWLKEYQFSWGKKHWLKTNVKICSTKKNIFLQKKKPFYHGRFQKFETMWKILRPVNLSVRCCFLLQKRYICIFFQLTLGSITASCIRLSLGLNLQKYQWKLFLFLDEPFSNWYVIFYSFVCQILFQILL